MSYCLQFVCVFFCLNFPFRLLLLPPLSHSHSLVAIPVHRYLVVSTLSLCIRICRIWWQTFYMTAFYVAQNLFFPLFSICVCVFCCLFPHFYFVLNTSDTFAIHANFGHAMGIQCNIRMWEWKGRETKNPFVFYSLILCALFLFIIPSFFSECEFESETQRRATKYSNSTRFMKMPANTAFWSKVTARSFTCPSPLLRLKRTWICESIVDITSNFSHHFRTNAMNSNNYLCKRLSCITAES